MTCAEIGRLLMVSGKQVHSWYTRRRTTGFPEPIGSVVKPKGGGRKGAPFFDASQVVDWYIQYDPDANRGAHWRAKRAQRIE